MPHKGENTQAKAMLLEEERVSGKRRGQAK
jgi:hypothetical protein